MNVYAVAAKSAIRKYRESEISSLLCGRKPFGSRHWEYPWVFEQSGIESKHGLRILDIAPDLTFPFSHRLKMNNHDVTFIDLEKRAWSDSVSWGVDPAESEGEIRIMDVRRMDFPDSTFDLIFCVSVLEHIVCPTQDPEDPRLNHLFDAKGAVPAIEEMGRCLKQGGSLLITVDLYGGERWAPYFEQWDIFSDLAQCGFPVQGRSDFSRSDCFRDQETFISQFHGPYITLGFHLRK